MMQLLAGQVLDIQRQLLELSGKMASKEDLREMHGVVHAMATNMATKTDIANTKADIISLGLKIDDLNRMKFSGMAMSVIALLGVLWAILSKKVGL